MPVLDVKPGDIIGFSGRSWISAGINVATYGIPLYGISHVGIIGRARSKTLIFESTELPGGEPCEITGESICGTQAHSLDFILGEYAGAAWHYPLYRALYRHEDIRLTAFLLDTIGREYDAPGAIRAGGKLFSAIEFLFRTQDMVSLFCSEWVAAAHADVGILQTANISGWSPNYLTRYERKLGVLRKPLRLK